MSKAYKLKHNVDHFKSNQDYDVWHDIKDRKEKFDDKFLRLEPFDELPPHKFIGKIDNRLSWLDFPCEKFGYPIVSKKMVDTLKSVGEFNHEIKSLTIHDWKSEKITDDFVFLHLLEWKDIIDRENSVCYPETGRISEFALKEPKGGYPPLFRVKDAGLKWFVSEEAKEALEGAEIKGVHFVPLIYPELTESKIVFGNNILKILKLFCETEWSRFSPVVRENDVFEDVAKNPHSTFWRWKNPDSELYKLIVEAVKSFQEEVEWSINYRERRASLGGRHGSIPVFGKEGKNQSK
jgi:hypothetical protein